MSPEIAALMKSQPGDSHPASGLSRAIVHIVCMEVDTICALHNLPEVDNVDEDGYVRALAPYLKAVKAAYGPSNPKPLRKELDLIRSKVREFGRWRRKPTAGEMSELVCEALGVSVPVVVSGGDAEARRLVKAPTLPALPAAPAGERSEPVWLEAFALAVGDNEMAQGTFIRPLLNMGDEAAFRAIEKIAEGRAKAKSGNTAERMVYAAQRQRKAERKSYVDSCLSSVRKILRNQSQTEGQL